ncbi:MAG: hypothetical protein QNL12_00395, partial [Acidimicrobiia bacterium]|nr:hypothetical protein [Acidimicrobiia bacterium]MDX2465745.1 hypothetical protein [Acidimicrobiia bacterium]
MIKRWTLPILLVCLALLAGACSDSDDAETTTTAAAGGTTETTAADDTGTETTAATETTATPSAEPIRVRAAITGGEDTINPFSYISGFPG